MTRILIKYKDCIIHHSLNRFVISLLVVLKAPLAMYRDRICAVLLSEAEQRIASWRSIATPALFPLLRSLAGKSSFFARSTRLLVREIARIESRQYLDSRGASREGTTAAAAAAAASFTFFAAASSPSRKRYFCHYVYSHFISPPTASLAGDLPLLHVVTPWRRRYEQSRFLEYTRDQETRPRDLVALERVLNSPRFVRVPCVIRGAFWKCTLIWFISHLFEDCRLWRKAYYG